MSYRDDAEALYNRATTLQQEVDQMREQLAERDRQLAEAKGGAFQRSDTSPGLRALRELPPAEELFSRLMSSEVSQPPPPPTEPSASYRAPPPPIGSVWSARPYNRGEAVADIHDFIRITSDERIQLLLPIITAVASPDVSKSFVSKLRELSAVARRA